MRCCERCGCYLPDNTTLCLSCGYDKAPEPESVAITEFAAQETVVTRASARREFPFYRGDPAEMYIGRSVDILPYGSPNHTLYYSIDTDRFYTWNSESHSWEQMIE